MPIRHAAVLVPGGGGNSPFTTPERACETGFAAGGQLTGLRAALLDADVPVYTCPARAGGGVMDADPGWCAFADGPDPLPQSMTMDSMGPVAVSGERLARFVTAMADEDGITDVHFVGYSMGGLISRDAVSRLRGTSIRARSLTAIGTPWFGSFVLRHEPQTLPLPPVVAEYVSTFIAGVRDGTAESRPIRTAADLAWVHGHEGVLDDLVLTLIAGTYFPTALTTDGQEVEANDGHVTRSGAWGIIDAPFALPQADRHELPDLHSNFLADLLELPWETAVNWDPRAFEIVVEAVRRASRR